MESGLLNAFHDDHFDGNYAKYDNCTSLWSDGTDTLGLQLAETLHGILPTTPIDEKPIYFDHDVIEAKPTFRIKTDNEYNCNLENNYDEFTINEYPRQELVQCISPSIEIISVDPNCEFSSPTSVDEDDEEEDDDDISDSEVENDLLANKNGFHREYYYDDDNETDKSSSIGDYESHSSDDDDDENVVEENVYENQKGNIELYRNCIELKPNVDKTHIPAKQNHLNSSTPNVGGYQQVSTSFLNDDFTNRIEDTNRVFTLEDDLLLNSFASDVKNFDLASFITQDDIEIAPIKTIQITKSAASPIKKKKISHEICYSDSDESIDIETVQESSVLVKPTIAKKSEFDLNESFTQVEDDPVRDPSWIPTYENKKTINTTNKRQIRQNCKNNKNLKNNKILQQIQQTTRNIKKTSETPPKPTKPPSYVVLDRKKFGLGRGKNISMCSKPESSVEKTSTTSNGEKSNQKFQSEIKSSKIHSKTSEQKMQTQSNCAIYDNRIEQINRNPNSNKNLANEIVIKTDSKVSVERSTSNDRETNIEIPIEIAAQQLNPVKEPEILVPVKKKLNLEEYKRRRCGNGQPPPAAASSSSSTVQPVTSSAQQQSKTQSQNPLNQKLTSASLQKPSSQKTITKEEIKSLLLKPDYHQQSKKPYDPILEAKNKVLRMQELKKAAQTKLIDLTVSAKVGPVTKILPLEEMTANGAKKKAKEAAEQAKKTQKLHPDYEEIIIVSASVNTEITVPPFHDDSQQSTLAAEALNISSTIEKANTVKLSSNSLISSIQDVVFKKVTPILAPSHSSSNLSALPASRLSPQNSEMSQSDFHNYARKSAPPPPTAANSETSAGVSQHEHGEDKIIMHLRKDRPRVKTMSMTMQTDDSSTFPPLKLLLIEENKQMSCNGSSKGKRKSRSRRTYRSRRSTSYTSSEDIDNVKDFKSRSRSRYRSSSPYDGDRSISPRSNSRRESSTEHHRRKNRCYSSNHQTSPHRRKRERMSRSRSLSRGKRNIDRNRSSRSKSSSSTYSESSDTSRRRDRSRDRQRRKYSTSPSQASSSTSKSRSKSRSRSRTRSRSHHRYSSGRVSSHSNYHHHERQPSPAVEERRIVYVGRIERETSKEDLKRKFMLYGPIRQITLHYKDTGMKYGFVTFERAQDAYRAIDSGQHDTRINMYDISFGGRRAFCRSTYSDLDGAATNSLQVLPYAKTPARPPVNDNESFEALLQKVKAKICGAKGAANKETPNNKT